MSSLYKNTIKKQTGESKWEIQHESETKHYENAMHQFRIDVSAYLEYQNPVTISMTENGKILATFQIK